MTTPCHCGLTREELNQHGLIGLGGCCTAVWADGSGNVCGKPLGAHPHQKAQGISFFIM